MIIGECLCSILETLILFQKIAEIKKEMHKEPSNLWSSSPCLKREAIPKQLQTPDYLNCPTCM